MPFWAIVAEVLKIILTVRKYIALARAIGSGQYVEGLLYSYLATAVSDALIVGGVPAAAFDALAYAREHLDAVLAEVGLDLTAQGLVIDADLVLSQIAQRLENVEAGLARTSFLEIRQRVGFAGVMGLFPVKM